MVYRAAALPIGNTPEVGTPGFQSRHVVGLLGSGFGLGGRELLEDRVDTQMRRALRIS